LQRLVGRAADRHAVVSEAAKGTRTRATNEKENKTIHNNKKQ